MDFVEDGMVIDAIRSEHSPKSLQAPLAARNPVHVLLALDAVLVPFFIKFIQAVIGEVGELGLASVEGLEGVGGLGRLVGRCGEADEAFVVDVDPQRIHTRQCHVHPQIEFQVVNQQWV